MLSLPHGWAESDILFLLSSHFLLSRLHHIDANKDFSETSRICAICAKFPCAVFPHSSLVCKTFPDKRSLDGKKTEPAILSSELNRGKCYKEELFFNARLKKMEGMRTMMPELGLRRRGKNSRGAAAAKRRKRASPQERLTPCSEP